MGFDLRGGGKTFHWNRFGWEKVLGLARTFGWQPGGTDPSDWPDVDSDNWDGGYFSNDGQSVTAEDAMGLANALETSLSHIPDEDVRREYKSGADAERMCGIEFFSGEMKNHLLEFVRFCRGGVFIIV